MQKKLTERKTSLKNISNDIYSVLNTLKIVRLIIKVSLRHFDKEKESIEQLLCCFYEYY